MKELTHLRTKRSKTMALDNGRKQLTIYMGDKFYKDKNKVWRDIDTSIAINESTDGQKSFSNSSNEFTFTFKENLNQENSIEFEYEESKIQLQPVGLAFYCTATKKHHIFLTPSDTTCVVENDIITFTGLYPDCEIQYKSEPSGMKEYINIDNIDSFPEPIDFGFNPITTHIVFMNKVTTINVDSIQDDKGPANNERNLNKVSFKKNGNDQFFIPQLLGWPKNNKEKNGKSQIFEVQKRFKVIDGSVYLLHGISHKALVTSEFPLTIDITITRYPGVQLDNGYCLYEANYPEALSFNTGAGILIIGEYYYNDGKGNIGIQNRGFFVRFPSITIQRSATINSAVFYTYAYHNSSVVLNQCFLYSNAEANAIAPTSVATFNGLNLFSNPGAINFSSGIGWKNVDVKNAIQSVVNIPSWSSGNALMLVGRRAASLSGEDRERYMYSSGNASYVPYLVIDFTDPVVSGGTTLASSGEMSIGGSTATRSINLALGRSASATSNLNEADFRNIAGSSGSGNVISLSQFHGKTVWATLVDGSWYYQLSPATYWIRQWDDKGGAWMLYCYWNGVYIYGNYENWFPLDAHGRRYVISGERYTMGLTEVGPSTRRNNRTDSGVVPTTTGH